MKKLKSLIIDFIVITSILITSIILVAFGKFQWKEFSIVALLIYSINTLFISFIVINNDTYEEKISWIFFLIVFPIIAHIFFGLFRIRRDIGISREEYENEFQNLFLNDQNEIKKSIVGNDSFLTKQEKITSRNFKESNIKIYSHGFEAYESLINDLKNAKEFIHIEMYIIKPSEIFEQIKTILVNKAQAGVDVKIIVDDFGIWKIPTSELNYLNSNNIQIKTFNKTTYPYVKHTDNKRMHRKFFVIDSRIVHFGGINISDEYSSYNKKYGYWVDLNFQVQGDIVVDYESIFLYDWYKITNEILDAKKYLKNNKVKNSNSLILLFDEGPNNYDNLLERLIINWINYSNKSLKIATPYFVPTQQIFQALKNALKIGMDIRIYIPGKPDKKIVYLATKHYLKKLVKYGAKVYVVNNIFLHSKVAIFDNNFAYIGTNNLDMRSIYTNYELINILYCQKTINNLNNIFNEYDNFSYQLEFNESKFKKRLDEFLFRILTPLM